MPFTSKIKADYVEMINYSLDNITIDSIEDFVLVQQALQLVILANSQQPITDIDHQLPEKYKAKILSINAYLKDPEDYVQKETDYDEYKQIIKDRITSKINELGSLNQEQKKLYIQNQFASKTKIAENQAIMSKHTPPQPGTDAHVLSEDELLARMQLMMNAAPSVPELRGSFAPTLFLPRVPALPNRHQVYYRIDDLMAQEQERGIVIQPRYTNAVRDFMDLEEDHNFSIQPR